MNTSSDSTTKDTVQLTEKDAVKSQDHTPSEPTASLSPGIIILGWLTYALWGWLIIALVWLMGVFLSFAIADAHIQEVIPYALAATIVLLPIAFTVDMFYRRNEPRKKTGAAMVIMIIHAVIFALCAIGALITAVFIGLSLVIEVSHAHSAQVVAMLTAVFAAILYVGAFMRTLNPFQKFPVAKVYGFAMLAIAVVLAIAGIAGPMARAISMRQDERINRHLPSISRGVERYVQTSSQLPKSLDDISLTNSDAESLIEDGLVTYVNEGPASASNQTSRSRFQTEHRYQLCVTYDHASVNVSSRYNDDDFDSNNEYRSYLSTRTHPSGEVCYKLAATAIK